MVYTHLHKNNSVPEVNDQQCKYIKVKMQNK